MYARILTTPIEIGQSFFLFGPRGTGKTTWLHTRFPDSIYLDLLKSSTYTDLLARPDRLEEMITPPYDRWIVIDEVQRVPAVLNEVHRLIENRGYKFILTGSSARTLRRGGTNLLAGRALTFHMYPFTAEELGDDFQIDYSLDFGHLPSLYDGAQPTEYLASYVSTYLREEVLQEGLTRSIEAFSRFIETASFSQAAPINYSEIAREAAINRKTIESYFSILADLLLSFSLPVFTKRAKRRLISHNKFYFFDAGVYRAIRPAGPLDSPQEIGGVALETLCLQEIRAINEYYRFGYSLYYWRTSTGLEVDFILYGQLGLIAIEVKHARGVSTSALSGLKAFGRDYPEARRYL
ncbi:MAG: ATP-binding protein, partial [Spirochaetales bacterium]|nr:ATP-binding protein [Spirochaetales bacterium]